MYDENNKELRKIIRRKTRYKTQVITFDKSELDELRQDKIEVSKDPLGMSNISVDVFLNSNFGEINKVCNDPKKGNFINHKCESMDEKNQTLSNLASSNNEVIKENISLQKNQISSDPSSDRMFSFKELINVFNNLEKRELYPKAKHDYSYKKQRLEGPSKNNINLEEQNIIHIHLEEEIIPSLKDNPFIKADKKRF